jgi:hypothetical protein
MAVELVKHRTYGSTDLDPLLPLPAGSNTGMLISQVHAPVHHTDTLLRTRSELSVAVDVAAPGNDIPPELWFIQANLTLLAFWVPSVSTVVLPAGGTSEGYLGSQLLHKRLVASPAVPTAYYVQFYTHEPLVTQTSRKDATAAAGPSVNFQLYVEDPEFTFCGTYADVGIVLHLRTFTVWGSIP